MSAKDVTAGGSGVFQLSLTNLSDVLVLNTNNDTIHQVGTVLYAPPTNNIQFTESQNGVSGTVTVNLAPTNGDLNFDGGTVTTTWNPTSETYTYPIYTSSPVFNIMVVGSYTLVTGGQTLSGAFSYTMNDNQDDNFTAAYSYYIVGASNYPSSLLLTGLGDCCNNEGGSCFQSPGVVVNVTATNGFHLQLQPGIEPYWAGEGPGELFTWSAPAITVPITSSAPYINVQPQPVTIYAGNSATFSISAVGGSALSYQWQFDTTNIANATNASLTLDNVTLDEAGSYSVVISDLQGTTNSAVALLTVNPLPPCVPAPSGIVGWWPGNGNAYDIVNGDNGTLVNGVTYAAGEVGQAFHFNGENQYVQIPDAPALRPTSVTLECWFNDANTSGGNLISKPVGSGANDSYELWLASGKLYGTIGNASAIPYFGYNFTPAPGTWYHAAFTFDSSTELQSLYLNGALVAAEVANTQIGYDSHPVLIGTEFDSGNPVFSLNGLVDEASIYNRALSGSEIQAIYAAGVGGKCGTPPGISAQPQSEVAYARSNISFTVSASGSLPLAYQWAFDGTNIPGAISNILSITNVSVTNLGTYSVLVENAYGETNSADAALSMYPFIDQPFTGLVTDWGYTNTLMVGAEGTGPLDYQWFYDGMAIDGATNSSFTLAGIQFTNAGIYTVVVSNAYGSTTNKPAQVVVNPAGISFGGLYPSVLIQGVVGYNYIIQSSTNLANTNAWLTLTNLTLTVPTQLWIDSNNDASLPTNPMRYYQVLPGQ